MRPWWRRRGPGGWEWLHWTLTILWLVLIAPTLLWWNESILWVALMSIWANVASHASAALAARADRNSSGR